MAGTKHLLDNPVSFRPKYNFYFLKKFLLSLQVLSFLHLKVHFILRLIAIYSLNTCKVICKFVLLNYDLWPVLGVIRKTGVLHLVLLVV